MDLETTALIEFDTCLVPWHQVVHCKLTSRDVYQ